MKEFFTNWRIVLLIVSILISAFAVFYNGNFAGITFGLQYGLDFTGGTYYQIQLEEEVSPEQMEFITSIMTQRIDAFGMKDIKVNPLGKDVVSIQIAETNPEKLAEIEQIIKTQAKFEAMLDGAVLFKGSEILAVSRNPAVGYGITSEGNYYGWRLPFVLSQAGAESFSKGIFHKCDQISFNEYDCRSTYFFIDRPVDSVIVFSSQSFIEDNEILSTGNVKGIEKGTTVESLLYNAALPYIVVTEDGFTQDQEKTLLELKNTKKKTIVPENFDEKLKAKLQEIGYDVVEVKKERDLPWVWTAIGLKEAIKITPEIAGLSPYIERIEDAKIFSDLFITGSAQDKQKAIQELTSLEILLKTGSLPVGIKSISKETISPLLGQEFLSTSIVIGIFALLLVFLVLLIRYHNFLLVLPIIFFGMIELLLTLGFSALIGNRLDLASVAGLITAIGTGLNDQIVIIDELVKGGKATTEITYANRVKKAFFIIIAAAATTIAALFPIILFSNSGFLKLRGFAITTILGVLIGITITRPAFALIAEKIFSYSKKT
ncbi:MAG: hypothetical protein QXI10_01940 [Candidatus Diapherotrites archaeon]